MRTLLSMALAVAFTYSAAAQAQTYPVKPIRLIVPLAPGGGRC
jgi:tripartite-type tricarboxylate transporter receptor subunit TctC